MGILKKKNEPGKRPLANALKAVAKKTTQAVKTVAKKPALKKIVKVGGAISTGGVSLIVNKDTRKKVGGAVKKVASNPNVKKIGKVAGALSTGGASLLLNKDNRQKVAAAAKKVAVSASTAAKKVTNAGQKVAAMALFLPFVPVAIPFLKRRGITPSKKPEDLVVQVFTAMGKKSFGLAPGGDLFDYQGADDMSFGYVDELESYGIIPVTPGMVIAVIGFLKTIFESIKKKQASGQPLTADEQEILNMAPQIDKELGEAKQLAGEVLTESEHKAAQIESTGAEKAGEIIETARTITPDSQTGSETAATHAADPASAQTAAVMQAQQTADEHVKDIKADADKDKAQILDATSGKDAEQGGGDKKWFIIIAIVVVLILLFLKFKK